METQLAQGIFQAFERLLPGVEVEWSPAGLTIDSPEDIQSEFFPPPLRFRRGFCRLPGQNPPAFLDQWQGSFFQLDFGSPASFPALGRWAVWRKWPQPQAGSWRLQRVESVPDLEAYRSLEPQDQLQGNLLDPHIQYCLAYDGDEDPQLLGKCRLTACDAGALLMRAFTKNKADLPELWRACENFLLLQQRGPLLIFCPEGISLPERYGFQRTLTASLSAKVC
jgi:hypothetical protein